MARPRPPIERVDSTFRINLDGEERELIQRLMTELRALLDEPAGDDRLRRLYPVAYHAEVDREKNDEYQRLMHDDLLESRIKGLDTVEKFLLAGPPHGGRSRHERLTEAQVLAFLQALNSVRLVLGTILDISEEHDIEEIDDDDPLVGEFHLYNFLSWVLDWTVRALQG